MQTGFELLDCGTRGTDFGFGLGERRLVWGWIETEQHVAGGNGRMILDAHLGDTAGNFTRDLGDICLDEGVLGRDVAAALQPRDQRSNQHEHRHADHRDLLHPLRHGAALPFCRALAPKGRFRAEAGKTLRTPSPSSADNSVFLTRCNKAINCLLSGRESSASAALTVSSATRHMRLWTRSASGVR